MAADGDKVRRNPQIAPKLAGRLTHVRLSGL